MNKEWFMLNPNQMEDRWWLYSSVSNCEKNDCNDNGHENAICYLIIQDTTVIGTIFYRVSTWYQNDPNRYQSVVFDLDWIHCTELGLLKGGDVVTSIGNRTFKVHECAFSTVEQLPFCKILEIV